MRVKSGMIVCGALFVVCLLAATPAAAGDIETDGNLRGDLNLDVAGSVQFGSAENWSDGGLNFITTNDLIGTSQGFRLLGAGTRVIDAPDQTLSDTLNIITSGDEIWFVTDSTNSITQIEAFRWFANGTAASNTLMELDAGTALLKVGGTISQNTAFDVAEAFWKSDVEVTVGDVVRIDPANPHAVKRSATAEDPAVLGVVSTQPGLVLGGGAFSQQQLAEVWGLEVATRYQAQRAELKAAVDQREDLGLKQRAADLASFETFLAQRPAYMAMKGLEREERRDDLSPEALDGMIRAEYARELAKLAQDYESAQLDLFFERNFARLALAGRVPVKVDASYGEILPGDLLVASSTPGHAMRAVNPKIGTVIGKALQAHDDGQGIIMMMVMLR